MSDWWDSCGGLKGPVRTRETLGLDGKKIMIRDWGGGYKLIMGYCWATLAGSHSPTIVSAGPQVKYSVL